MLRPAFALAALAPLLLWGCGDAASEPACDADAKKFEEHGIRTGVIEDVTPYTCEGLEEISALITDPANCCCSKSNGSPRLPHTFRSPETTAPPPSHEQFLGSDLLAHTGQLRYIGFIDRG